MRRGARDRPGAQVPRTDTVPPILRTGASQELWEPPRRAGGTTTRWHNAGVRSNPSSSTFMAAAGGGTMRNHLTSAAELSALLCAMQSARCPRIVHVPAVPPRGEAPPLHSAAAKAACGDSSYRPLTPRGHPDFAITPGSPTPRGGDTSHPAERRYWRPSARASPRPRIADLIVFCALDAPPSLTRQARRQGRLWR